MPQQEVQQPAPEAVPANVVPIFARRPLVNREPPPSAEELAEYRRMKPLLLKMLEEWEQVTAAKDGCPVARQILCGRK